MTKNGDSVLKVLVRRVGPWKAARLTSFLVCYSTLVLERDGERVSMEDYGEVWAVSRATAYRLLGMYREAVPEYEHPHDLLMALLEVRESTKAGEVLAVPAGLLGLA